jgi:hypothetical protein
LFTRSGIGYAGKRFNSDPRRQQKSAGEPALLQHCEGQSLQGQSLEEESLQEQSLD